METPWVRFCCLLACFCTLLPTFLFFFSYFCSLHPGMFIFSVFLRLWSSHLLLSASTYFIVRVLSACVICILPHLGNTSIFIRLVFSRSSYFSGGVFCCCCALVPGTLALDLPTLISDVWFFSVSLWPQNLYLSRMKNQEGHWGYCWCRWVERTV